MDFQSAEQAVRFAYNIRDRAEYARTDMTGVRGTSTEKMSPLDLHAQASMILSAVGRLHPVERDSILAQYARGPDRSVAIRGMASYLMPFVRGMLPRQEDVELVLLHWSTKRPSIRAIAEDRNVSYRTVCSWRTAVLRAWMPVQTRAVGRLHESLFRDGGLGLKG